jgi:four helix bundle protein
MRYKELDVYKCSIQFTALAWRLTKDLPRGQGDMSDQLKRAALSVPLNIGEGSGRRQPADRSRHYAIARGSAMECSAVLDVMQVLELGDSKQLAKGQDVLIRIVSMLTKMCA